MTGFFKESGIEFGWVAFSERLALSIAALATALSPFLQGFFQ